MTFRLQSIQQTKTEKSVLISLCSVLLIYFAPFFWQLCSALVDPYSFDSSHDLSHNPKSYVSVGHDHHQYTQRTFSLKEPQLAIGAASQLNLFETCSYCSLLFHLNWLDVKPFELIALAKATYPILFLATLATIINSRFTSLKPRAPPQPI
ncbi:DUF2946 domain-containing protein [Marinomonas sp. 15G1-11]|uniref:DUF2946 domain-containing protein n=1 Tax=Marinomonas phaeophyticola TaxID=3004091 RepID=A0ABT4JRB3_9GAMM|nr:DUF2946 domain-containing protein [Marinomonas sp. 15G1-11]MCZ2720927.1 DUF2946 domain-containing protein [Marinomonas sp. 15G1-11]